MSTGLSNGTFTGSAAANRYGNVQVQVVVTNGKITKVEIVQYPDQQGKSVEINNEAIPKLIAETLQAQSASVDNVSGATYTSTSYEHSMQSAIDQAHTATAST
ncbi:MAG TPA: FMN-binding protein [Acidimicrobiia bacterium]